MKRQYKLLVIGEISSTFIINFVKFLKAENPLVKIYFWGEDSHYKVVDDSVFNCFEKYCIFDQSIRTKRIPVLRFLEKIYKCRNNFKSFTRGEHFDIINIQYIRGRYMFLGDCMRETSSKIVLCPWGSDVLRVGKVEIAMQKMLYNRADFVKGPEGRFTDRVKSQYGVPEEKLVPIHLGSSLIDYIIEKKKKIDCDQAKNVLGLGNYYIITCGYNASSHQNHFYIIDAVYKVKDKLPPNLLLLFPLTYAGNLQYVTSIKKYVCELGIDAVYYEEFLDIQKLFLIRQATDMFVHVQSSDSFSASIREYLLCGKKVVNGGWLRYTDLEIEGDVPYFVTKDLSSLADTILYAYNSKKHHISNRVCKKIEGLGWCSVIKDWNAFFSRII